MEMKIWVGEIKKVLSEICDEEFQKKYWILGDPKIVSSFEETINRLFDDLNFDGFLEKYRETQNDELDVYNELIRLRDSLSSFLAVLPSIVDPKVVVGNDEWKKIGLQAKALVARL
jgi:hypothetical protein